jgi:hypothetical protein
MLLFLSIMINVISIKLNLKQYSIYLFRIDKRENGHYYYHIFNLIEWRFCYV